MQIRAMKNLKCGFYCNITHLTIFSQKTADRAWDQFINGYHRLGILPNLPTSHFSIADPKYGIRESFLSTYASLRLYNPWSHHILQLAWKSRFAMLALGGRSFRDPVRVMEIEAKLGVGMRRYSFHSPRALFRESTAITCIGKVRW